MKTAVVTGSYQGIGKGIADLLSQNGYTVVYSDVHEHMDGVAHYCKCNIADAADRNALLAYVDGNFGRLDLLVNNAGVACKVRMDILETTEESFDRLISINTKGTFFYVPALCELYDKVPRQRSGRLLPPHREHSVQFELYVERVARGILHFQGGRFHDNDAVCR